MTTTAPTVEPIWTHEFRHEGLAGLFAFRDPGLWLDDLLGVADLPHHALEAWLTGYLLRVDVTAPERTLRFLCVLLNQHAEQSPGDATPVSEAERLEETLRGAPKAVCPSCGETNRWKLDTDVTVRCAVYLAAVAVDRATGEPAKLDNDGTIECVSCGFGIGRGDPSWPAMRAMFIPVVADATTPWRVVTDTREF